MYKMLPSLILLLASFGLAFCELYFIVPTETSSCAFNRCLTLAQLTNNNISSNATLIMLEGDHVINFDISVSRFTEFHMLPFNDTSNTHTYVTCADSARFTFTDIDKVEMKGLTFVGCDGTMFQSINQLIIESSTILGQGNVFTMLTIRSSTVYISNTYFLSNTAGTILFSNALGGAMMVTNSSLEISSCTFNNNGAKHGGAIFSELNSEIMISNSTFTSNHAIGLINGPHFGGAIYVDGTGTVAIFNSSFQNNTANLGGAIAVVAATGHIRDDLYNTMYYYVAEGTAFSNNRASVEGGALYTNGSQITLSNCNISDNYANKSGGAIASNYSSFVRVINSQLISNKAESDGGVLFMQHNSTAMIHNSTIINNFARGNGGAVYAQYYSFIEFRNNCSFNGNLATFFGGVAVAKNKSSLVTKSCVFMNNSARSGAVLYASDNIPIVLADCRFTCNKADVYGGAFLLVMNSTLDIDKSSFSNNEAGFIGGVMRLEQSCSMTLNDSNFSYNRANRYGGVASIQENSELLTTDSTFSHNYVTTNGGGVLDMNVKCRAEAYRSHFENNTANVGGVVVILRYSRIFMADSVLVGSQGNIDIGGAIRAIEGNEIFIQNCRVSNNSANFGGVLAVLLSTLTTVHLTITEPIVMEQLFLSEV